MAEFAAKLNTTRQNVENLERGEVTLPKYLVRLAQVMGCSTDELLGHRSAPARPHAWMIEEPSATYSVSSASPLSAALEQVRSLTANMDPARRSAFAQTLADWIRSDSAQPYQDMLQALVSNSPQPRPAVKSA